MLHAKLTGEVHSAAQTRQIDQLACAALGCDEFELMQSAAAHALALLEQQWPTADSVLILCGKGHNAGDALLLAALAARAGYHISIYMLEPVAKLAPLTRQALAEAQAIEQIVWCEAAHLDAALAAAELVVDGLLGIGFVAPLRQPYQALIARLNAANKNVLALDLPSGLDADTGAVGEPSKALATLDASVVNAHTTLSFITLKPGQLIQHGLVCCGSLWCADLDVPHAVKAQVLLQLQFNPFAVHDIPARHALSHKHDFGRVLVVGGSAGMGGAAILCAQAAARAGAGLVTFASLPEHCAAMLSRCPDVMVCAVTSGQALEPLLQQCDVIVIGPGLCADAWSQQMFAACLAAPASASMVVDAGALDLLRSQCSSDEIKALSERACVLTPHPGEAARFLNVNAQDVQADRLSALDHLITHYPLTWVLKGAGTLVAEHAQRAVTASANPALATAGSGDVLAGIISALLAQGLDSWAAANIGVQVHALTGQACVQTMAERSVLASDLVDSLTQVLAV